MSDYRVYIKCGSEDVEIIVPDIYKDPDSETNSDQIKTYIANDSGINYTDFECDIKRNGRFKRKCHDCEILDGDELTFYKVNKIGEIDITKLKLKTGFYNIQDEKYHNFNFTESDLQTILSSDDNHKDKISEVTKILNEFLSSVTNDEAIAFISCLTIFKFNNEHLRYFPFNFIDGNWFFGFLNSSGLPCGYGYCFCNSTKTYFEGNFSENNIFNGKSLRIDGNNSYYSTGDFYTFFRQNLRGFRSYIFRNETYLGSFNHNEYHTGGKLVDENGTYHGSFNDGKKNGYGMMLYKNGDQYLGFWSNGTRNCFGKMKYSSGDYYSGTWHDGKKEIFGNYFDIKYNITYIGTFKDDKKTFIKDEFKLISGNTFYTDHVGEHEFSITKETIESSEDSGKCRYRKTSQHFIYEYDKIIPSSFMTELIQKLDSSKQTFYIGHFDPIKNFYGIGKLYYNYGDTLINNNYENTIMYSSSREKIKYSGFRCFHSLFEGGFPNGFGMIDYENGDRYIGDITNGQVNGEGLFIKTTGERVKALWYNGHLVETKYRTMIV